ncbi:MAG: NAD-dependent epimerase/dehydratase family protein, partial [bacterium]|nr:NAD-dependent epimerase/dehydratase family protein [bacterium]
MNRKKIFLTGATGSMGQVTLKQLLLDPLLDILVLVRDSTESRNTMSAYQDNPRLSVFYGDLTNYQDVLHCLTNINIVLHVAALVSPAADDFPADAMKVNYGGTVNIIEAIKAQPNWENIRLVSIGTIAQTGDRMPPIHWGRVGDPLKASVHDYYAVSKIAAERAVIESGLKYWVSLRQTGILSEKMAKTSDAIIFHNPLDNVLEYVTDHDSGILMAKCCQDLPDEFWGHIYNIGGGESCRMSGYNLLLGLFKLLGFKSLEYILDSKWFAIRNFHGHYYLDSDKLENMLHFRTQSKAYFFDLYVKSLGLVVPLAKMINMLPFGEKIMGKFIRKRFEQHLHEPRGTMNWIENNLLEYIEPFFISKGHWNKIPPLSKWVQYPSYDQVIHIDHGYDDTKPQSELTLDDVKAAAFFRGGICLDNSMTQGDWAT